MGLTELWEGLQEIAHELNELGPVVLSPDAPQTVTVSVISGPTQGLQTVGHIYDSIQILQKGERGTYLFASNVATDMVVAEFSGLSSDVIAVEVLYEGRMIPVSAGSFRDTFAEADVHIYRAVASITFLLLVMKTFPLTVRKTLGRRILINNNIGTSTFLLTPLGNKLSSSLKNP